MIFETLPIKLEKSASYASMKVYAYENREEIAIRKRPTVVVFPGGAYAYTSAREADPIAMKFVGMGYNAAVELNNRLMREMEKNLSMEDNTLV